MSGLDGFLLAGGLSSRMGRDKAMLALAGERFVERLARVARPHVRSLRIVGREGVWCGIDGIADLRPGLGPLAGIETALSAAAVPAALVLACDLPLVTSEFLGLLADRAALSPDSIVVPLDAEGRVSPLCGIYPRAALAVATSLLDRGERKPRLLLDAFPTVFVRPEAYAHLDGAPDLLRNVNTPEEYESVAGGLEPQ